MIKLVYADDSNAHSDLLQSMYKDRALQFRDRLKWNLRVDDMGQERDQYDDMNPLYLILEQGDGSHEGSLRLLPTTTETMINDHFCELFGGVALTSPFIWEVTRFCLTPGADDSASRRLLLGGLEFGLRVGIQFYVGVFSKHMIRVYDRIGWSPLIIGEGRMDDDFVCAGVWPVSEHARLEMIERDEMLRRNAERVCFGTESWLLGTTRDAA